MKQRDAKTSSQNTPTLPNDFERMVPEYHRQTITYGEHISRYMAALPLVKDKVVLDIACGSGYGTKLLTETAQKVIGVDVAEEAVTYAKAHYSGPKTEYRVGNGTEIPLDTASVDVVITLETIEHIEDYRQFMSEVKRVLRPGGIMILSTPNDLEFAEGNHFHVHEFKFDELKKLVKDYFLHAEDYYQGTWIYAGLFSDTDIKNEWDNHIRTVNTVPLDRDKTLYFFLVCSDEAITQTIPPIGVISEHWSARDIQEKDKLTNDHITNLQWMIDTGKNEIGRIKGERDVAQKELNQIKTSRTYQLAQRLQHTYRKLRGR